jgi:hypothetical protein
MYLPSAQSFMTITGLVADDVKNVEPLKGSGPIFNGGWVNHGNGVPIVGVLRKMGTDDTWFMCARENPYTKVIELTFRIEYGEVQVKQSGQGYKAESLATTQLVCSNENLILSWWNSKSNSACATCDGFFYKNKEVMVVGGGDTAAEEATYLAKLCTKVTLLVRRNEMRASKAMQKRVFNTDNLEVLFNHETKSINGEPGEIGVESVTALNNITGQEIIIPAKGFFVAIGHTPNTSLFKGQLDMDENGYLIIEAGTSKTKIPGVFAAGDVADHVYRQAVTSAGTGCMAALDAERFLASQE